MEDILPPFHIRIFLLPNIDITPKNPISVGPHSVIFNNLCPNLGCVVYLLCVFLVR